MSSAIQRSNFLRSAAVALADSSIAVVDSLVVVDSIEVVDSLEAAADDALFDARDIPRLSFVVEIMDKLRISRGVEKEISGMVTFLEGRRLIV